MFLIASLYWQRNLKEHRPSKFFPECLVNETHCRLIIVCKQRVCGFPVWFIESSSWNLQLNSGLSYVKHSTTARQTVISCWSRRKMYKIEKSAASVGGSQAAMVIWGINMWFSVCSVEVVRRFPVEILSQKASRKFTISAWSPFILTSKELRNYLRISIV